MVANMVLGHLNRTDMEKILFISPSTLDRKSTVWTLIVCMLPILFFGWMFFRTLETNNTVATVITGCMIAMSLGIFILGIVCTPHKYILTDSHLIVKRHFKDIVIPLQNIKCIRQMTANDKKGMLRTFGAEGVFGSWGYYSTSAHKELVVFARRYDNRTLVITDRKKYVIAPDDLQLIDAVMQQTGQDNIGAQHSEQPEHPARRWIKLIPAAIILSVVFLFYFGYKEPKIIFNDNALIMKGMYSLNIPFTEMSKADTIAWSEMPAISIRTNGFSLFKVKRGHFRTHDGEKIRLNVHCGVSPVIRIVDCRGAVYYINRKNAAETRKIFNQLTINN